MDHRFKGRAALIAACGTIFWPGAFIFSFPGLMGAYWRETFQVGSAAVGQTLFFVLATLGVFMFFVGRWQEKFGPAQLAAIGAVFCGAGTLLLGYASSIVYVYVWAFMMGVSSSCIYIPALTVAQRWYPQKRGLVSGLVNLVFGLSAALLSPIYAQLLNYLTYNQITIILGLIALICGLAVAPFVRFPETTAPPEPETSHTAGAPDGDLTVSEGLRTAAFWFLWLTWAFTGAAGIAMIPLSTSFGLSKGLSAGQAVLILTAFNLTNGLSRLASGYLSDIIGRNV
ncbi:MAG: MFS transporter, partial [Deltaproteobacteria bacterium]|nr:MFS transporter [Deltaproteobacteria bacterium]